MNEQALETLWEIEASPGLVWGFLEKVECWHSWWPKILEVFAFEQDNSESYCLFWRLSSDEYLGVDLQVTDRICGEYMEAHLEGGFVRFALRPEGNKTQIWVNWAGLPELNLTPQMLRELGQNLAARIEASRWMP